jgi:hypothetical protein
MSGGTGSRTPRPGRAVPGATGDRRVRELSDAGCVMGDER